MVRWVVGSNLHGGPIELFLVPAISRCTIKFNVVQSRTLKMLILRKLIKTMSRFTTTHPIYLFVCLFVFNDIFHDALVLTI